MFMKKTPKKTKHNVKWAIKSHWTCGRFLNTLTHSSLLHNRVQVRISLMSKGCSQWERLLRALIPLLTKWSLAADWRTLQGGAQRPAGSDHGLAKQGWTSHNSHSMKTKAPALSAEPLFPLPENLITDVRSISSASSKADASLLQ